MEGARFTTGLRSQHRRRGPVLARTNWARIDQVTGKLGC